MSACILWNSRHVHCSQFQWGVKTEQFYRKTQYYSDRDLYVPINSITAINTIFIAYKLNIRKNINCNITNIIVKMIDKSLIFILQYSYDNKFTYFIATSINISFYTTYRILHHPTFSSGIISSINTRIWLQIHSVVNIRVNSHYPILAIINPK